MKDITFYNNIKNEFINIKNSVEDNEININGPIGSDSIFDAGYTFDKFKKDLSNIKGKIVINIKSYGGNLFEALAIYDSIRALKNKVTTRIVGSSASAATVISLAGDERLISKNSRYLIHKPMVMAAGNSDDFTKVLSQLQELDTQLVDLYVSRTNLKAVEVLELMAKEEFISSEEAIKMGFIDGYIEEKSQNKPKNNNNTEDIKGILDSFLNDKKTNIMELIDNLNPDVEDKVEETVENTTEEIKEEVTPVENEVTDESVENKKNEEKEEEDVDNKKNEEEEEEEDKDKVIEDLKKQIKKLKKELAKNEVDEAEEKALEIVEFLDDAVKSGKIKEEARDEWMNIGVDQGINVLKTLMSSIPDKKVSTERLRDVVTKSDSFKGKEDIINQWKSGKIDTETYLKLVKNIK